MTPTVTPSTHRASFAIGDEVVAKPVVDLLTESFFEGQAAIAAWPSKKLSVRRSTTGLATTSSPMAKLARWVEGVTVGVIEGPVNARQPDKPYPSRHQ